MTGKPLPRVEPSNDRERAEDLVLAARHEKSLPKLRKRVNEALALDPDCISAHVLLAEVADTPIKALAHCRDAIASGERALADELADAEASLWHHPVGRTFLRARYLHAEMLWQRGDRPLAISELRTILRHNPGDNQGVRYQLLVWLLKAGSVADIDALLAEYDDASAAWLFGAALHQFRTRGPDATATAALREAIRFNPHVLPMLLGDVPFPDGPPDTYSPGEADEAEMYVCDAMAPWFEAVGAMEWAAEVTRKTKTTAGRRPKRT